MTLIELGPALGPAGVDGTGLSAASRSGVLVRSLSAMLQQTAHKDVGHFPMQQCNSAMQHYLEKNATPAPEGNI
jgi:hypothetical protein